jgi:hypothetical protein
VCVSLSSNNSNRTNFGRDEQLFLDKFLDKSISCAWATSKFCQFYLRQFYGPTFCRRVIVLHVHLPCIFEEPIYAQWRTAHFLINHSSLFFYSKKHTLRHATKNLKFINFDNEQSPALRACCWKGKQWLLSKRQKFYSIPKRYNFNSKFRTKVRLWFSGKGRTFAA